MGGNRRGWRGRGGDERWQPEEGGRDDVGIRPLANGSSKLVQVCAKRAVGGDDGTALPKAPPLPATKSSCSQWCAKICSRRRRRHGVARSSSSACHPIELLCINACGVRKNGQWEATTAKCRKLLLCLPPIRATCGATALLSRETRVHDVVEGDEGLPSFSTARLPDSDERRCLEAALRCAISAPTPSWTP